MKMIIERNFLLYAGHLEKQYKKIKKESNPIYLKIYRFWSYPNTEVDRRIPHLRAAAAP